MYKLLLADDSVTIQRVIELTFSGEDVQVVAVNDGEQAIARIPLEHPDVVLADIGMPHSDGYDVAAFVKGRPELAHIPVLLLAGAFEPVDQARAEQVRADGVLIKPFEPRQVIERVKELLAAGQHRYADRTSSVVEGSLAHPVIDFGEEPVWPPLPAAKTAALPPASEGGQSLDELFESLNQALSASAQAPPAVVAPKQAYPAAIPVVVAPLPPVPEPAATGAATGREPEMSFEALVVPPGPAGSVEDYFDHLSPAFTDTRTTATPVRVPDRFEWAVGTNSDIRGFSEAPAVASPALDASAPPQEWLTLPAPPTEDARSGDRDERHEGNPILDAVTALVAHPSPVMGSLDEMFRTPTPACALPATGTDPQDIVDAITERVLAKLAPAVAESLRQIAQQEIERSRQGGS